MWGYVWPLILVVLSNVIYHITSKSTPADANPFFSLIITYIVGGVFAFVMFLVTSENRGFAQNLEKINWTAVLLGFAIVGLEVGYIYMYRSGWNLSVGSLVANISLAVILIGVGALFYNEIINLKQIIGISLCVVGLVLVNMK